MLFVWFHFHPNRRQHTLYRGSIKTVPFVRNVTSKYVIEEFITSVLYIHSFYWRQDFRTGGVIIRRKFNEQSNSFEGVVSLFWSAAVITLQEDNTCAMQVRRIEVMSWTGHKFSPVDMEHKRSLDGWQATIFKNSKASRSQMKNVFSYLTSPSQNHHPHIYHNRTCSYIRLSRMEAE